MLGVVATVSEGFEGSGGLAPTRIRARSSFGAVPVAGRGRPTDGPRIRPLRARRTRPKTAVQETRSGVIQRRYRRNRRWMRTFSGTSGLGRTRR